MLFTLSREFAVASHAAGQGIIGFSVSAHRERNYFMVDKLPARLFVIVLSAALLLLTTPTSAQTTSTLPLAEPGPYTVGVQIMTFVDTSRDGRALITNVWYPALAPETPTE